MYLLDTDTLSNLLKRSPSIALIARLAAVPTAQQFTSSITVGEMIYGARRVATSNPTLLGRVEAVLLAHPHVLPFDTLAARRYGEIRAEIERSGTPLADADLRIAAIALVHGLTLITANTRHFVRVPGLKLDNWLT